VPSTGKRDSLLPFNCETVPLGEGLIYTPSYLRAMAPTSGTLDTTPDRPCDSRVRGGSRRHGLAFLGATLVVAGFLLSTLGTPATQVHPIAFGAGPLAVASPIVPAPHSTLPEVPNLPSPPGAPGLSQPGVAPLTKSAPSWAASNPPTVRQGAAFAYDGTDRADILFGGVNGSTYLGDTWKFLQNQWIQLGPVVAPSPRAGASLAYDSHDGYLLLFGGWNAGGPLHDTWEFAHGVWTQLSPATNPSSRGYAAMTYDAKTGDAYIVLFGGKSTTGTLGDTWKYVHGVWTLLTATGPQGRSDSSAVYDTADQYVLLFGGRNQSGSTVTYLHDTWTFAAGGWSQVSPSLAPAARADLAMVYDPVAGYTVLFGGANLSSGHLFADTWTYVGGAWTHLSLPVSPAPRWGMESAWDNTDHYVLVAEGSLAGNPLTATDGWNFSSGVWHVLASEPILFGPQPAPAMFPAFANDPLDSVSGQKVNETGTVLYFGGATSLGMNNQTWLFDNQFWTERFPAASPSPREAAALVCDTRDGYMLLFGGRDASGISLGDTWKYQGGVWTLLSESTAPAPRFGAAITFDAADNEVILFGGYDGSQYFGDTWAFSSGAWTHLSPTPAPSARAFPAFTYDAKDGDVALFGGLSAVAVYGDTWTFVGGIWKLITESFSPTAGWDAGLEYIANDNVAFFFGGCGQLISPTAGTCNAVQNTTLKFYSSKWHTLTLVGGSPAGRFAGGTANDGVDNVFLVFGGSSGTAPLIDRWEFAAGRWVHWAPVLLPTARSGTSVVYSQQTTQMVFFGGFGVTPSGANGYLNQTWLWDTGVWGLADPNRVPSSRAYAVEGFDAADNYAVMFGGFGPSGYLGDTWTWLGGVATGDWTQRATHGGPSPRANASISYDTSLNEILLFGGQGPSGGLSDTWAYHAGAWTQLTTTGAPSARTGAAMVYDITDHETVLFGGLNTTTGKVYNDTWTLSAGVWTQLALAHAPAPRYGAGNVWATARAGSNPFNYMMLFGGVSSTGSYLGDTWTFVGGVWTQVLVGAKASPDPAAFISMSCDTSDGNPVLFGGYTGGSALSDFWVYR
jgi:Galactose oxidase, central domain/Kelch motif